MFLSTDSKSSASSANISCLCVFTCMCVYVSNVCVTVACIGAMGGDDGFLSVFCVSLLADVENCWK